MGEKKKEVKKKNSHQTDFQFFHIPRTFGQKAADSLTKWAGSWTFILLFMVLLIIWVLINSYFLIQYEMGKPWDPYPFILLNLFLSCIAAIQAPIILMSQNRQVEKDRIKVEYDYAVNRKAEKEIREIKSLLIRRR
ncbi:MAG: DUF1003 domain-containing protein [Nanoarchaeota archaeon]|nr:DUF1003 domain-containing protein [Nanoarchaeota archaeon]